jgi:probable F420-dependent oxidoreductase
MRFSISIPQHTPDGTFDPVALRAYLRRAEELGFEGAWTGEQTLGTLPHLGPIETLSFAAACTDRIRLGCAVFVATQHNPVQLAKSISTLDQLSRGRVEVGLGTGGRHRMFSAFDAEASTIVARFNEGLQLMKALWTHERVTFPGRFWQLDGAAMEPKTFQKPGPPVWFGGGHPAALRRSVQHADGIIGAGSSTTAAFTDQVRILREALDEAGRDPATLRVAKRGRGHGSVRRSVPGASAAMRDRERCKSMDTRRYFGLSLLEALADRRSRLGAIAAQNHQIVDLLRVPAPP